MWIQKGKLCGKTLKTSWRHDKPNLNKNFKSYLGYHDLQGLCNSLDYFERLQKNLFAMIRQLGSPMFFVTFSSTKRLWDHFIKALHMLHALRLNFSNKIKDLQSFYITH